MVQWKDPQVQILCGFTMALTMVFFLGMYSWYFVLTWHKVEWRLITRKTNLKVAYIPYLIARYCQLGTLISLVVSANDRRVIVDCQGASTLRVTATLGNLAVVGASTNFALRAVVMWRDSWWTLFGLCMILVAHTALALALGLLGAVPVVDPVTHVCSIITSKSQHVLVGFYSFTLAWDLLILFITIAGMSRQHLSSSSSLWTALFRQGFGYLVTTCVTSIPIMVLVSLNLNDTMNVILAAPGGTINVIISSSFVMYLLDSQDAGGSSVHDTPSTRQPPKSTRSDALTTHIDLISTVDSSHTQEEQLELYNNKDRQTYDSRIRTFTTDASSKV